MISEEQSQTAIISNIFNEKIDATMARRKRKSSPGDATVQKDKTKKKLKHSTAAPNKNKESVSKAEFDINSSTVRVNLQPQIPTKNGFTVLTDKDGEIILPKPAKPVKKVRVPPLNLSNYTKQQTHEFMKKMNITSYTISNRMHVIQLYCNSLDDFDRVCLALTQEEVNYYTHNASKDKIYRVVLKGLHNMDEKELKAEILSQQLLAIDGDAIVPKLDSIEIRKLTPKSARYHEHMNYIVQFKMGEARLAHLKQIRSLFHTLVSWETYIQRKTGPVQCNRCQRPGHGSRCCNMPFRCKYCAGPHDSQNCPKLADVRNQLKQVTGTKTLINEVNATIPAKCCNCNADGHFADSMDCPKKIKYAETRRRMSNQNRTNVKQHVPVMDEVNFPSFIRVKTGNRQAESTNASTAKGTYAQRVRQSPGLPPTPLLSNFNFDSDNLIRNENPFTPGELIALTSDVLSQLHNVKTASRQEILMAVMNISIKYLYNEGA